MSCSVWVSQEWRPASSTVPGTGGELHLEDMGVGQTVLREVAKWKQWSWVDSHVKSTDPSLKQGEEIFHQTHNENKPAQNVKEHGASVKKDEDLKEKIQDRNDHSVKDHGKPIIANDKEEVVNESEKETSKPLKPKFKCDLCGATFKKNITLKKHVNTKHDDQNCKVCHEVFKTSMEVLKHVAKEHSSNIKDNISVKDKEHIFEQDKEDIS